MTQDERLEIATKIRKGFRENGVNYINDTKNLKDLQLPPGDEYETVWKAYVKAWENMKRTFGIEETV